MSADDTLKQTAWAIHAARNSIISAGDFIYGKLADNARMDANRAKRLLWENREQIAKLIDAKDADPSRTASQ